jgi:superfamily II DNA/RNA helicase
MTTTVLEDDEQTHDDREAFKELKKRISGDSKTFLIKVKQEERQVSSFEQTHHLYALVSTMLDKFLILFDFVKLAIIEGKTAVFVNDVIQAYRIKYFLAKFSIRSFVLSPDMPKN